MKRRDPSGDRWVIVVSRRTTFAFFLHELETVDKVLDPNALFSFHQIITNSWCAALLIVILFGKEDTKLKTKMHFLKKWHVSQVLLCRSSIVVRQAESEV